MRMKKRERALENKSVIQVGRRKRKRRFGRNDENRTKLNIFRLVTEEENI